MRFAVLRPIPAIGAVLVPAPAGALKVGGVVPTEKLNAAEFELRWNLAGARLRYFMDTNEAGPDPIVALRHE